MASRLVFHFGTRALYVSWNKGKVFPLRRWEFPDYALY